MITKRNNRWTIGFLIDYSDSQYQFNILQGIADCAQRHDANLLCFEGGIVESMINFDQERNIIYDLVTGIRIDGVIILSDSIAHLLDQEMLNTFARKFHPLPIVSVGRSHKNIHSLVIDSSSGMKEMMYHLIKVHDYKKFAFIKGLQGSIEASIRYKSFCDVLEEFSIPVNPDLIFEGDYLGDSGKKAVTTILDELNENVDVIVASNDEMAIGALNELSIRGIDVPGQIAVIGFDDVTKSTTVSPPLSTVRQPLHREGWTAVEMLLSLLDNKETPLYRELSSVIIIRESCGCNRSENSTSPDFYLKSIRDEIDNNHLLPVKSVEITNRIALIVSNIYYNTEWMNETDLTEALVKNYIDSGSKHQLNLFLNIWKSFLDEIFHIEKDAMLLRDIVESLFSMHTASNKIFPFYRELHYRAEDILKDKIIHTIQIQNYQSQKETWMMNVFRDELHINLSMPEILDILYDKLVILGIRTAYMAFYETTAEKKKNKSRLVLAFHNNARYSLPEDGLIFNSTQILPNDFYPNEERFSWIVESLNYAAHHVGYVLFDMTGNLNSIYGSLRRIISNVIHGSYLISHIEEQRNELIAMISKLRATMSGVIRTLAIAVEIRDPYTAGHQRRVADLSRRIAEKLKLSPDTVEGVTMGGIVHDIGKIFIPAEILNKPGKLLDIEFNLIKHHPEAGYNILKKIDFPWPIANIVLQHHERCDGTGYPHNLKQDQILVEARILIVADVVEAITSMRPYRAALGLDVAINEISHYRGTRYDPDVVDACLSIFREDNYQFKTGPQEYP
ncbi:MAG: substrate-binding domain-containing protein [Spirochaetales bacterium]|nr:substrate-binding domain-containing protein [Spirochaetales bacterium]